MATLESRDAKGNPLVVGKKYQRTGGGGTVTILREEVMGGNALELYFLVHYKEEDGKESFINTDGLTRTDLIPV